MEQYSYNAQLLYQAAPCNVLVWGLGQDSVRVSARSHTRSGGEAICMHLATPIEAPRVLPKFPAYRKGL
eukprot:5715211-Pyramimonas_sp.AAC.1